MLSHEGLVLLMLRKFSSMNNRTFVNDRISVSSHYVPHGPYTWSFFRQLSCHSESLLGLTLPSSVVTDMYQGELVLHNVNFFCEKCTPGFDKFPRCKKTWTYLSNRFVRIPKYQISWTVLYWIAKHVCCCSPSCPFLHHRLYIT